jgi:hypothetical protein
MATSSRASLESIAREVGRECSLEAQLAVSLVVQRYRLAAAEAERERASVRRLGVVDRERGWELQTVEE